MQMHFLTQLVSFSGNKWTVLQQVEARKNFLGYGLRQDTKDIWLSPSHPSNESIYELIKTIANLKAEKRHNFLTLASVRRFVK